jgi:ATP-dependent exoDNAse (exonuclease V) beta subunit
LDITILPRGKELGIVLHQILEKIPFSELSGTNNYRDLLMENSSCYSIISEKIHNLAGIFQQLNIPECMNEIAKIIWNSLMTRIDSDTLRLCEIHNKVHEIEFHYALSTHGETKKIFLNGFIDLLFEYNKKYYILDWKSNFIKEGYSQGHLYRNIIDSQYDLQYKIYALAVVRWLKRIIPDFSYDIHFGGIYYLYLRGIDATDPSKGIYFFKPENESILEKYEGELFQIIL